MACKLQKRVEIREITLEEYTKQKAELKFSEFRQMGKQLNFLQIFGGSPRVFVNTALETAWTREQADEFIDDNHLHKLRAELRDRYKKDTEDMISYLTVATFMRKGFFELYAGLMRRILANQQFGKEHGYVRSYFGLTRKLVEELLRGEYDEKEHGAQMRNLDNVCANTDIQTFEACVAHPAMVKLDKFFEEQAKKSRIFSFVHDAIDFYVHKSELHEVCAEIERAMTEAIPELKGVPLAVDFTIADLSSGDYYKSGKTLASFKKAA